MDFWGAEVKAGQTLELDPGDDKYIHISQVALGEIQSSKGEDRIVVYIHSRNKKYAVGTLIPGKSDQFSVDVVFSTPFKLSHTSHKGTIFFIGYNTPAETADDFSDDSEEVEEEEEEEESSEDEQEHVDNKQNAIAAVDGLKAAKPEAALAKAKTEAPKQATKAAQEESSDDDEEEDEEDEDDEDDDEDEDNEDEAMQGSSDDEEDSDGDDEDDEEESEEESDEDDKKKMPKVDLKTGAKKRPAPDSSVKTPATAKKAKVSEAQKQGTPANNVQTPGKKGQTTASKLPQSSKKEASTPVSGKKLGDYKCVPCQRNFANESALQQHTLAKHGSK
eukprot:TRINITY_DN470_c0_g1_i3.p1 TRINITY_DN470_c0_g1~~TRINITY_DN470_c0_g1_i3.p1  ORF type:complete len:333 (-),score=98.11 TRINITY_DN470_c0_g1_i3:440-1438(-)